MASLSTEVAIAPTTLVGTGNDVAVVRIQSLEVPAMIMVSAPFNGSNWLSWSRFVRIALEDRDKLSFIDRSNVASPVGTPQHKQWRIADCVVRTWILSTISKDIVNAFLYASSLRDLWMELEARYGECDGTLLYKLQREINSISQNKVPNDLLNVHFAQATEVAGMATQNFGLADCNFGSWIVDTGATSYMCGDKRLFHSLTTLKTPKRIHLPDNRITQAT
ncbi:UNVERIFIED_CONTAM: hypothetical protein Sradi_2532800 [Sesamum radiatum]|uniref:Retrotransposon Copia-like N-terminal domain-containing protein n=1 Tax=Sesamum radiatum TaxID=300843 RepID=A0AAW2SKP8_SESRA